MWNDCLLFLKSFYVIIWIFDSVFIILYLQEFSFTKDKLIKHSDLCLTVTDRKSGTPITLQGCQPHNVNQVRYIYICNVQSWVGDRLSKWRQKQERAFLRIGACLTFCQKWVLGWSWKSPWSKCPCHTSPCTTTSVFDYRVPVSYTRNRVWKSDQFVLKVVWHPIAPPHVYGLVEMWKTNMVIRKTLLWYSLKINHVCECSFEKIGSSFFVEFQNIIAKPFWYDAAKLRQFFKMT